MKTMISKYPGTCAKCGGTFARGSTINWFGRGHAEHAKCGETVTVKDSFTPDAFDMQVEDNMRDACGL